MSDRFIGGYSNGLLDNERNKQKSKQQLMSMHTQSSTKISEQNIEQSLQKKDVYKQIVNKYNMSNMWENIRADESEYNIIDSYQCFSELEHFDNESFQILRSRDFTLFRILSVDYEVGRFKYLLELGYFVYWLELMVASGGNYQSFFDLLDLVGGYYNQFQSTKRGKDGSIKLDYVSIGEISGQVKNKKTHQLILSEQSINKFGYFYTCLVSFYQKLQELDRLKEPIQLKSKDISEKFAELCNKNRQFLESFELFCQICLKDVQLCQNFRERVQYDSCVFGIDTDYVKDGLINSVRLPRNAASRFIFTISVKSESELSILYNQQFSKDQYNLLSVQKDRFYSLSNIKQLKRQLESPKKMQNPAESSEQKQENLKSEQLNESLSFEEKQIHNIFGAPVKEQYVYQNKVLDSAGQVKTIKEQIEQLPQNNSTFSLYTDTFNHSCNSMQSGKSIRYKVTKDLNFNQTPSSIDAKNVPSSGLFSSELKNQLMASKKPHSDECLDSEFNPSSFMCQVRHENCQLCSTEIHKKINGLLICYNCLMQKIKEKHFSTIMNNYCPICIKPLTAQDPSFICNKCTEQYIQIQDLSDTVSCRLETQALKNFANSQDTPKSNINQIPLNNMDTLCNLCLTNLDTAYYLNCQKHLYCQKCIIYLLHSSKNQCIC